MVAAADDAPERGPLPVEPLLYLELECEQVLAGPARWSLTETDLVELGRGDVRQVRRSERTLSISVPDLRMSSRHARLIRVAARWIVEDQDSKNGTVVNGKPVRRAVLEDGDLVELGRTIFLYREHPALETPLGDLDARALKKLSPAPLQTLSPGLGRTSGQLRELARSSEPVLIRGEPGTGKTLLARTLHQLSRTNRKLVTVDCRAWPGSRDRFGAAGTLLFDELGDLPPRAQTALFDLLGRGDARVVCASRKNLDAMVQAGTFDGDLFARLAARTLELPPLRERCEDLGLLLGTLLRRADPDFEWAIDPEAARALFRYRWPGNVRELEQALARAAPLARDGLVLPEQLPPSITRPAVDADAELGQSLRARLAEHAGNVAAVARALGKNRSQVRRWLQKLGIDAAAYR